MKKVLSLVLVGIMAFGLAGCTSDGATTEEMDALIVRLDALEKENEDLKLGFDGDIENIRTWINNFVDSDTVYNDAAVYATIAALVDNDTLYDDTAVLAAIAALEALEDKDTLYDDADVLAAIGALETWKATFTIYDGTNLLELIAELETELANGIFDARALVETTQEAFDFADGAKTEADRVKADAITDLANARTLLAGYEQDLADANALVVVEAVEYVAPVDAVAYVAPIAVGDVLTPAVLVTQTDVDADSTLVLGTVITAEVVATEDDVVTEVLAVEAVVEVLAVEAVTQSDIDEAITLAEFNIYKTELVIVDLVAELSLAETAAAEALTAYDAAVIALEDAEAALLVLVPAE